MTSLHVAEAGKNHSVGGEFIIPVYKDIVETMWGEMELMQLDLIPLSNDTVCHHINEVASDVENQ